MVIYKKQVFYFASPRPNLTLTGL